jgi:hypothetical protein
MEHMALKASQPDATTPFSLEDVFDDAPAGKSAGADKLDKLAWVNGWRKLPHLPRDVEKQFDYPQQFAEDMFDRMEQALRRRVTDNEVIQTGCVFIAAGDTLQADLPIRHIAASDMQLVAAQRAVACDEPSLLRARREGKYILSYQTSGGWVGITKDILTEVLGAGRDVTMVLPPAAAGVLKLMCPNLVILRS